MFLIAPCLAKAEDVTIALRSPKKSNAKLTAVNALNTAQVICDTVVMDITPYPAAVDSSRYTVEYFLDNKLLYSTNGVVDNNTETLSFRYAFDTTKFENGNYHLYVNFNDTQGAFAIGGQKIVINNQE